MREPAGMLAWFLLQPFCEATISPMVTEVAYDAFLQLGNESGPASKGAFPQDSPGCRGKPGSWPAPETHHKDKAS